MGWVHKRSEVDRVVSWSEYRGRQAPQIHLQAAPGSVWKKSASRSAPAAACDRRTNPQRGKVAAGRGLRRAADAPSGEVSGAGIDGHRRPCGGAARGTGAARAATAGAWMPSHAARITDDVVQARLDGEL